jgi:hypothetical protein
MKLHNKGLKLVFEIEKWLNLIAISLKILHFPYVQWPFVRNHSCAEYVTNLDTKHFDAQYCDKEIKRYFHPIFLSCVEMEIIISVYLNRF